MSTVPTAYTPSAGAPRDVATPVAPFVTAGARLPEHLRSATVLVVDDQAVNLNFFQRLLSRGGYQNVYTAADGNEALEAFQRVRPDLIVLDLLMPGLDGFGVMEALSAEQGPNPVPVLVLSGDERPEVRRRALSCGARDFLAKPFDPQEALLRIQNLLEVRALHRLTVEAAEARYRALVEEASDPIYRLDTAGRIAYANRAARALLGDAHGHATGISFLERVRAEDREAVSRQFQEQVQLETPEVYSEFAVRTHDGREVWIGQKAHPDRVGDRVVGVSAMARDITQRRLTERVKDELISVVSHELRTPLTAIRASLGLLSGGLLETQPERAGRMLDVALRNTERLTRLVNDFLDLERMAAGKLDIVRGAFPLRELVAQVAEEMRPVVDRADVWLVCDVPDVVAHIDADRVHQVLNNLLSNAVKFSPPTGTVWVGASLHGDELELWVRDQGPGIPAGKLESVFERFEQVDASDARKKGGSGLGLAICRSIVRLHGGRIWAESLPGKGSTFRFTLPASVEAGTMSLAAA
jgi:PAS domain S-box-containing protein